MTERQGLRLTQRVATLGTESAFDVADAARALERAGHDIVHLEIGEPDIPTPQHIVEAGIRALRDGATRYAPPAGLPELRDAIARSTEARGLDAAAERIVVTSGAKPMLLYATLALVNAGDEVLVPDPGFPIYESLTRLAGGKPVPYDVDVDGSHGVTAAAVAARISPRTRVLILNAPNNPTGSDVSAAELDALAELCLVRDIAVISDEIYSRLRFGGPHESIATRPGMSERTVVVNGFSKAYAMTGWRLGYGIVPAQLTERVVRLIINSTSCAPPFVQRAGIAALTGPQDAVENFVRELRQKRDAIVRGLNAINGITCRSPAAAFYAFSNLTGVLNASGLTTEEFAHHLLHSYGTATLAGTGFGARGSGHIRLSFAAPTRAIEKALERIQHCVQDCANDGAWDGVRTPYGSGSPN